MKKLTPRKYAVALYELIATADEQQVQKIIKGFVRVIARNKDLSRANAIMKAFTSYFHEQQNIVALDLYTARSVSADIFESVKQSLAQAMDKTVELQTHTDAGLIGGAVLRYGDTVIDGSVRRRLQDLASTLQQ